MLSGMAGCRRWSRPCWPAATRRTRFSAPRSGATWFPSGHPRTRSGDCVRVVSEIATLITTWWCHRLLLVGEARNAAAEVRVGEVVQQDLGRTRRGLRRRGACRDGIDDVPIEDSARRCRRVLDVDHVAVAVDVAVELQQVPVDPLAKVRGADGDPGQAAGWRTARHRWRSRHARQRARRWRASSMKVAGDRTGGARPTAVTWTVSSVGPASITSFSPTNMPVVEAEPTVTVSGRAATALPSSCVPSGSVTLPACPTSCCSSSVALRTPSCMADRLNTGLCVLREPQHAPP